MYQPSECLLKHRSIATSSTSYHARTQSSVDDALDILVNATYTGWIRTHEEQGGRDAQLRIYRRSIGLQDIVTCPSGEFYSESSGACVESTPFDPTVLIGALVAAFVVILAAFFLWHRRLMKKNEARMREDFGRRMMNSVEIANFSANDPTQLTEMFKQLDGDENGFIEKQELRNFMDKREPVMSEADFNVLWKSIDADKSGTIDYIEFCIFVAKSSSDIKA